jgi:cytochrome c biogenesis protein CcmG, thiol:disulfide interchange protein DsbE
MNDELIRQLALLDPVPDDLPPLPAGPIMQRIAVIPAPARRTRNLAGVLRGRLALVPALAATAAVILAVVLVATPSHGSPQTASRPQPAKRTATSPSHRAATSTPTGPSLETLINRGMHPKAPDANRSLHLLNSRKTISLSRLRGRVVMINFFASWCPPCKAEVGVVRKAERMLAAQGGTVLGVTYEDSPRGALAFKKRYKLDYPIVTEEPTGSFARAFDISGVPDTFIINSNGRIEAVRPYQLTSRWITRTLRTILHGSY